MKKNNRQDILYAQPLEAITDFVFDESVVRVFQDMIGRSVPGYSTLLSMLPVLTRRFVSDNSRCYDLGCSLGASTLAMRHGIQAAGTEIIAVDNSTAMIEKCHALIEQDRARVPVKLVCADIADIEILQASMVVMNFTLQFINQDQRLPLLEKIYLGMKEQGVFVLSEKIQFEDDTEQSWMTELHHDFKKANGYSDLEISQKRSALENVLIPESVDVHLARLESAGFKQVFTWFQCFNFVSILAIK